MIDTAAGILKESYLLLNKMSPYLLFGFFFAGVIHIFIDTRTVGRHLGGNDLSSVVKASIFGIPLPLCSCGVIPAAVSLKKDGASRGAVVSFLISTPTTGVDSILATYSLLGWFFTAYRVAASFVAGVFSGILANIFIKGTDPGAQQDPRKCRLCGEEGAHDHPVPNKISSLFKYAFGSLLGDTGGGIILGILIGGSISFFIPEEFIRTYLGEGWRSMVLMLIIAIPMYVCASGSIPIAAALMLKGMNPGAAFVFLLAGPATNAVGMTVIAKQIGKRATIIYVVSIAVTSIALGMLLDIIWKAFNKGSFIKEMYDARVFPVWVGVSCSIILLVLIGVNYLRKGKHESVS